MQVSASVRAVQVPDDNPMHPLFTTIYLVGRDQVLTIDSGEDMERYRWMLKGYLAASERAEIALSAVTHHHRDHSSNLKWLRDEFQAEIYVVEAAAGLLTEQLPPTGVHRIAGGGAIDAGGVNVQVIETPGHSVDSVCYYLEEEGVLFSGDTILGSTPTTIIDLGDYLASLDSIRRLANLSVICPGHGPLIKEPRSYIDEYIRHRREREDQILAALAAAPELTSWEITERIYTDINPRLRRAADGNVRTHLRKLEKEGRVKVYPGRAREVSPEQVQHRAAEENEHAKILQQADEIREQARRRALVMQESPSLEEWDEPPRFELVR
jgi:endoribonuclease LACTB2